MTNLLAVIAGLLVASQAGGLAHATPPGTTSPSTVEPPTQQPTGPGLSGGRMFGELVVGMMTGVVGFGVARVITGENASPDCHSTYCLVDKEPFSHAAYVLVAPLGVYAIGTAGDQTGSILATYAGSIIGFNLSRRYERRTEMRAWVPSAQVTFERTTVGLAGNF